MKNYRVNAERTQSTSFDMGTEEIAMHAERGPEERHHRTIPLGLPLGQQFHHDESLRMQALAMAMPWAYNVPANQDREFVVRQWATWAYEQATGRKW